MPTDFENFVLTQIGRDGQARAEKMFYVKIYPLIFLSQNKRFTIHRKT